MSTHPKQFPVPQFARGALVAAAALTTSLTGLAGFAAAAGAATAPGTISTVAGTGVAGVLGDGSAATSAEIDRPDDVVADQAGDLAIADTSGNVIRFVPPASGTFFGRQMSAGDIYTIAGDGTSGATGDGGPATAAELADPEGVAFDGAGDVVVADTANNAVRVVADTNGTHFGEAMVAGDIYDVAGNGTPGDAGDGAPATQATLDAPASVTVEGSGIAVADESNNAVRYVAEANGTFFGVPMTSGDISTIVGTSNSTYNGDNRPAITATLSAPSGVAFDHAGALAIADNGHNRIRFVPVAAGTYFGQQMSANCIYTVAGNGTAGSAGDNGRAASSEVDAPLGVAFDPAGNLAVADTFDHKVRLIADASESAFGLAMSANDIYTVAGTGTYGFSGDNGVATAAELGYPDAASFGSDDALYIDDQGTNRIRTVTSGWAPPTFTSPASGAATIASAFSIGVSASGSPAPSLSIEGNLPGGVVFLAGQGGAATISGTPTSSGTSNVTILATSLDGSTTQSFALTVAAAPVPTATAPPATTATTVPCPARKTLTLDPHLLAAARSRSFTIIGCDKTAKVGAVVTARVVSPHAKVRTLRLRITASHEFQLQTGVLGVGETIVRFELANVTVLKTAIRVR